ncbi:hypothetical protein Ddye_010965 [Dipteronia dyeriana]|uniref:Cation/H+ exchanger transmembrane domain-containing protein n=1 Tax=Dipteronia dyeriana TaxID=168575 RepID=A0AAE0CPB2_9ROSI|nr:hypothetical protein Ddye_010965 [Dipteronia dyeriana]
MGQTVMVLAVFNDIAAWILLALAVAITKNGNGEELYNSSLILIWVILSSISFIAFMFILIRPVMKWLAYQCSSEQNSVEGHVLRDLPEVNLLTDDVFLVINLISRMILKMKETEGGTFLSHHSLTETKVFNHRFRRANLKELVEKRVAIAAKQQLQPIGIYLEI